MSDTKLEYWYMSYVATRSDSQRPCHRISPEHPVDFAIRASKDYKDGPYVVLFTMRATKEQFDAFDP